MTDNERLKKFEEAPDNIKVLYSSPLAQALTKEMTEKYSVNNEAKDKYLDVTGDVILGFRKIAELPYLLQTEVGLSQEAARQLTGELIDAWEPVVLREEEETQQKKASVASLADKIAAIKPSTFTAPAPASPEPASAPTPAADFESVKPMRTMQSDIDDKQPVHGYGALRMPEPATTHDDEPVIKATPLDELRFKK